MVALLTRCLTVAVIVVTVFVNAAGGVTVEVRVVLTVLKIVSVTVNLSPVDVGRTGLVPYFVVHVEELLMGPWPEAQDAKATQPSKIDEETFMTASAAGDYPDHRQLQDIGRHLYSQDPSTQFLPYCYEGR